ncbi:MAG: pimeloyl-ACP methyl ester esterase BioH [Buchnera aphidicola (Nurudea yanoniella)]
MTKFQWITLGNGKENLILIHGWGFNSTIWNILLPKLKINFKIHLVDLPGFGINNQLKFKNLNNTAKFLEKYIPDDSILLGWSMGGLIVNKIAILYPQKVKGIINVASSPCFIKKKNWPGISKKILYKFYYKLNVNYQQTILDFITLQITNSKHFNVKMHILKGLISYQRKPSALTLKKGLKLICSSDLRKEICKIKIPFLRIYGYLDILVPKEISKILDTHSLKTKSIIMRFSSHAPFISETYKFCSIILRFVKNLNI